jgi:cellulose synthase/poly-beta-1,6-N-acetylglucosamine synthase-like glycosyltransferase
MDDVVLVGYFISLFILFIFGCHGFIMMYYHNKYRNVKHKSKPVADITSKVTIQLPLYNELYVVDRLITGAR